MQFVRFTTLGFKDLKIRKFEFVTKINSIPINPLCDVDFFALVNIEYGPPCLVNIEYGPPCLVNIEYRPHCLVWINHFITSSTRVGVASGFICIKCLV